MIGKLAPGLRIGDNPLVEVDVEVGIDEAVGLFKQALQRAGSGIQISKMSSAVPADIALLTPLSIQAP